MNHHHPSQVTFSIHTCTCTHPTIDLISPHAFRSHSRFLISVSSLFFYLYTYIISLYTSPPTHQILTSPTFPYPTTTSFLHQTTHRIHAHLSYSKSVNSFQTTLARNQRKRGTARGSKRERKKGTKHDTRRVADTERERERERERYVLCVCEKEGEREREREREKGCVCV